MTAAEAPALVYSSAPGRWVLAVTVLGSGISALDAAVAGHVLAAALPGIRVVTDPAMLPATKAPAPLSHLALLVHSGDSDAATLAAVTTARVAGVCPCRTVRSGPRADDCDTGPTGKAVLHTFRLTAGILEHDEHWTSVVALGGAAPPRGRWSKRRRGPTGTGGRVPLVSAHGT